MISQAQRQKLIDSGHFVFSADSQRADLLDPTKTNPGLIAFLIGLCIDKGHHFGVTAINSDHPTNDGGPDGLGHNAGCAIDGAPMASATPGDWVNPTSAEYKLYLEDVAFLQPFQTGFSNGDTGGPNDTGDWYDNETAFAVPGLNPFHDDGGAHVHHGARKVVNGNYVN